MALYLSVAVIRFIRINSFQDPVKVMMARVTETGAHMGKTMRVKIFIKLAPSILADSSNSSWMPLIKSVHKYTPIGSPKAI